jgi:hypothetical protein
MRSIASLHADRLEGRQLARKPISLDGTHLHERYPPLVLMLRDPQAELVRSWATTHSSACEYSELRSYTYTMSVRRIGRLFPDVGIELKV